LIKVEKKKEGREKISKFLPRGGTLGGKMTLEGGGGGKREKLFYILLTRRGEKKKKKKGDVELFSQKGGRQENPRLKEGGKEPLPRLTGKRTGVEAKQGKEQQSHPANCEGKRKKKGSHNQHPSPPKKRGGENLTSTKGGELEKDTRENKTLIRPKKKGKKGEKKGRGKEITSLPKKGKKIVAKERTKKRKLGGLHLLREGGGEVQVFRKKKGGRRLFFLIWGGKEKGRRSHFITKKRGGRK